MNIPLSQYRHAVVDREDYHRLHRLHWLYRGGGEDEGYAVRHGIVDGKERLIYLHREVMNAPPEKDVVFLTRNTLDCRRSNLKVVSKAESRQMHRPRKDSASGVKGVWFNAKSNKYCARITRFGVTRYLGSFDNLDAAADAYNVAAREQHPENNGVNSSEQDAGCSEEIANHG